ncbi:DUF802 domain-containing protein [Variovorax paradoxus]|uniref:DUF802 domain-containing protein n=1 Tax=Variovorax paradoxus TaxID=34073 RepID=A0A5Q0M8G3_VARPD|nr:DUF802 domain-containing protein [Variovorax paradoxus]QFZ84914.1 DUF802 domain-containing protein [Variovorax paradoxus]
MNRFFHYAVFLVGLAVVCWVGASYVGHNPLALVITALIGAFYLMGALELHRFHQATNTLSRAVDDLSAPPATLGDWLANLHPSLRNAVRLRIEGERVGLPGPALTPYLAGLLVLLGMLGTFLGMVVTLNGTGLALESATDVQAIRNSLSAPVRGLGLAFGTSVAGVAASAMLGLASALCRRERLLAGQALDTQIATSLRGHSLAHRREESFKLMQQQAHAMPALVDQLQAMVAAIDRQSQSLNERLVASQDSFHQKTEAAYTGLAASVDRSLKDSLADSARIAGETIQPVARVMPELVGQLQTMMAAMERQTQTQNDRLVASQDSFHQKAEAAYSGLAASVDRSLKDSLADSARIAGETIQPVAKVMPELVGQLQTMMAALERQTQSQNDRLVASQDSFHQKAEAAYSGLAASVDRSLKESLTDTARIAGATIQPVVEAAMLGIAREAASLQGGMAQAVERQLEGLTGRFEASTAGVADTWKAALAEHERASGALSSDLRGTLERFAETFEQRSAALVDGVSARLESTVGSVSDTWGSALAQHQRVSEKLSGDSHQAVAAAAATFEQHSAALLRTVGEAHTSLQTELAARDAQRLSAWSQSLEAMAASLQKEWQQAGAHTLSQQQQLSDTLAQAARDVSAQAEAHAKQTVAEVAQLLQAASDAPRAAASLLDTVREAHANLQTELATRDAQRLAAWSGSLETMAASLQKEWQQAGAHSLSQQQQMSETLAQTVRDMSAQAEANAKQTVAEVAQLLQVAAEAPKAAADVIAELRQKLSDGMARDNDMLEERSRILGTLETLLGAVNHASTEQRSAIDALVTASADMMERVGSRFTEKVESETEKMAGIAAQITGGAVEVASLGEAFGFAVQRFGESNDKLVAHLQRIEGALGKSLARSDEQLAYYVAQAREVIDLSIMSQKQIVEDLQQFASRQTAVGSEA